jgi:DNA-directed RNA polymerase subunit M/transcription elongation factor TFIIS
MGSCLKGKSEAKPQAGAFRCEKCGAASEKKKHLCKPAKIKGKSPEKKRKKKDGKK